jgi:hypothetical protein
MIRLTKTLLLPKSQVYKLYTHKFKSYLQLLSFDSCYFALVSVSLMRVNLRRLRENLKHKIRAQAPSQDKNPDWTLRRPVASAAFDVLFSLMIPEPERFKPQWNIEGTVYILGQ